MVDQPGASYKDDWEAFGLRAKTVWAPRQRGGRKACDATVSLSFFLSGPPSDALSVHVLGGILFD